MERSTPECPKATRRTVSRTVSRKMLGFHRQHLDQNEVDGNMSIFTQTPGSFIYFAPVV